MRKYYSFLILLFTVFISNAQIVNIPDANFKAKLLSANINNEIARDFEGNYTQIDTNNDGEIQESEAELIFMLDISNSNISNLTGIDSFVNLIGLNVSHNQLVSLSISNQIESLDASHNQLTSLNVIFVYGVNFEFENSLDLSYNSFTSLAIENAEFVNEINLSNNQLTHLTLNNVSASNLFLQNNNLENVQFSSCIFLQLNINTANLDATIVTGSLLVDTLYLGNNLINKIPEGLYAYNVFCTSNSSSLDLTSFTSFSGCSPSENFGQVTITNSPNLETISIKNGVNHTFIICDDEPSNIQNPAMRLNVSNCPNLSFICVDEAEQPFIQASINQLGLQNQVQVNSYCSFEPGGTFYTIQGNNKFDNDNNGCDATDLIFPNQKFTITNGTISGSLIANQSGTYSIPVQSGSHTITPVFENPSYFTVSPASATVSFPATASPATRNFCITANGVKNDLEVTIIPIGPARPGFDAHYRIIYKNKGNQVANGSLNFTFDDAIMDLVSATPVNDNAATNSLSWNYANLVPFETREIYLIFNINSPMETPAVNSDDVLDYTATIVGATDETPNDNTFTLNQTVVNSYDPNDKTCLEGATITPSMVGQYVHYVIRFENTGTFAAENIVVKDMIDTTKFDVSTLIPQHSSHDFFTRINGEKVEFIFENINLPFDDANNDGYVAFKIKTKPTLVLGDTFSNSASIYFDYNFPIVTEPAVTTIVALNTNDFDFGTYFSLYPNPAKDVLNFEVKNVIGVKSVSVYNTLGQIVMAITNVDNLKSIDVSSLTAGSYFVKVYTDKGSSSSKFIKQ
ncbi:MAG: T9SS type A sorting domain-containing protein [Flavobacterium sp.]|uniref:DUF7619 domain-containing protein n=1 Tax=Flavobacterium sp. TaxID=239 RepID=UPI0022CD0831|nr:T9SS type A sorting domain-containing protein [Flavobacterium sp.]MCZ8331642.1 T9SS type A sorting domain-containing protein [Flavobacterium sp.]